MPDRAHEMHWKVQACRRLILASRGMGSVGDQRVGAAVHHRMARLGHGPGFDLADPLPGQGDGHQLSSRVGDWIGFPAEAQPALEHLTRPFSGPRPAALHAQLHTA